MNITVAIITLVIFINTVAAIITVFKDTREISATWAWLLVLFLLPVVGFIMYLFFGKKLSKQNIFDLKSQETLGISEIANSQLELLGEGTVLPVFENNIYLKDLATLFLESDESIITKGNKVELIIDGEEKFAQLMEDILNAKHHIHMIYYIFKDDDLGRRVMDALIEKASQGIEVLVIYDAMGSRTTSRKFWKKLEEAGGKAVSFFPQSFAFINFRINYRNHRKIVVIDGVIGYVGGFNIGNEYLGISKMGYWRDSHLRIQGNAVLTLQSRFFIDWNAVVSETHGREYSESYFPISKSLGPSSMQIVSNGPDSDFQKIKMGFIKMISMAKESIYIQSPYFIPDESVLEALSIAALSGVDVRIMIPSKPDHPFVYRATEFYSKTIIESGVKVYIYQNGFLHAKTMVVDSQAATVGTSNFDVRSFKLNFEVNAFIYDAEFAKKMEATFMEDIKDCTEATKSYFEKQSSWLKFKQTFSRLFSPIL